MNGIRLDKFLGHHQLGKRSRIIFVILMTSWVSTITLLGYSQPTYSQMNVPLSLPLPLPTLTATTCGQLQLSGSSVSASGFESPNTPSNTLDNNLNTRWSNPGLPSFIQYNLGQYLSNIPSPFSTAVRKGVINLASVYLFPVPDDWFTSVAMSK